MYTLPLGYAARAIRAVSAGTGEIASGFSDIGVLLVALPGRFVLRFLTSLFLYRQVYGDSPAVSLLLLVAKSKKMLFLNLRAFILSVKIDFATSIRNGHEPDNVGIYR